MSSIKKVCSIVLAFIIVVFICPIPHALAADTSETMYFVEDLGNGIMVETTIEITPSISRDTATSAVSTSRFTNNGEWIATVALKAFFKYNGMTAGVTGTEYAKELASGWSYTNHNITTTTLSTSSGGTATLTATLKKFPVNVPVRLSLHCAPDGTITRG